MLVEALEQQYEKGSAEDKKRVASYKKLAWERWLEMGLPTRKTEGFEYLPLESFSRHSFPSYQNGTCCFDDEIIEKNIDPECSSSYIVMINGEYSPELSCFDDELIHAQTLEEAYQTFGFTLRGKLAEEAAHCINPFTLLNVALFEEGIFLSIAKYAKFLAPLQILHIITHPSAIHPRMHLYLGKEAELNILTRTVFVADEPSFVNECWDIWLEEKALLTHTDITLFEQGHHFYVSSLEASLKQKANYKMHVATNGSEMVRKSYHVELKGPEASSELKGVAHLRGSSHAHIFTHFHHAAERTISNQHVKAMLQDKARFSFDGKIYVTEAGLYSQAYQLNNNFLLSDQAAAFSKPNLEIFADDVKASHGCTTAKIDEEELFYLTSRGLNREAAKELLTKAFLEEILQELPLKGIQDVTETAFRI